MLLTFYRPTLEVLNSLVGLPQTEVGLVITPVDKKFGLVCSPLMCSFGLPVAGKKSTPLKEHNTFTFIELDLHAMPMISATTLFCCSEYSSFSCTYSLLSLRNASLRNLTPLLFVSIMEYALLFRRFFSSCKRKTCSLQTGNSHSAFSKHTSTKYWK